MSNPKGRTIPEVLNTYLLMLIIYSLDLFLFQSDRSVLGDNFYSRFVCIAVLFIIIWIKKASISTLGITRDKRKIFSGFIQGIFFTAIPLIIVTAVECIYFSVTDTTAISLKFNPPSMKFVYSSENLTPFIAVLIYIISTAISSVFKEFFFRGYTLKKLKTVMDFNSANLIQSLLYMMMTAPYLLRNFIFHYYDAATTQLIVFIIIFYIVHETVAGIKWGLMTRLTGSTAAAVFDHFFYVFLANSIYITDRYVTWTFMIHTLAIQLISLGMVYAFYRRGMKKVEAEKAVEAAKLAEEQARIENEKRKREESRRHSEKLPEIGDIEAISPNQFKQISRSANRRKSEHRHAHKPQAVNIPVEETVKDLAEGDIDSFLESYSHPNREKLSSAAPGRITEDFDPDKFLENYGKVQKKQEQIKREKQSQNHTKPIKEAPPTEKEPDKTPEEKAPEKITEPPTEAKPAEEKAKARFRFKDIFEVDASESNELI